METMESFLAKPTEARTSEAAGRGSSKLPFLSAGVSIIVWQRLRHSGVRRT